MRWYNGQETRKKRQIWAILYENTGIGFVYVTNEIINCVGYSEFVMLLKSHYDLYFYRQNFIDFDDYVLIALKLWFLPPRENLI